jgi:hypothetical protein
MHHLGIGTTHARKRVLAIAGNTTVTVTVIELETREILSTHHIEPTKTHCRNQQKPPANGQEPQQTDLCRDSYETYVATHHTVDLLTRYSNHAYTRANLDKAVARAKTPRLVPTLPPAQPHAMAPRMDEQTRLRIADEYRAGVSPPLIGSRYGISRNSVMDIVANLGVPRRRRNMQLDQVAEVVDLYQAGWSLARIDERIDFDPTTIRNRLLAEGIAMRNSHGCIGTLIAVKFEGGRSTANGDKRAS